MPQQFRVKYYYSHSSFRTPPVPPVFQDNPVYRRRRERADLILINFSSLQLFNFDRALASQEAALDKRKLSNGCAPQLVRTKIP